MTRKAKAAPDEPTPSAPSPQVAAAPAPAAADGGHQAPAAGGHKWKGEGVEPDAAGQPEAPEDLARRAEGNAPVSADTAAGSVGTFDWKHPPPPGASLDSEADARENEEEKREAAAEEHAAEAPKHAPHGRL